MHSLQSYSQLHLCFGDWSQVSSQRATATAAAAAATVAAAVAMVFVQLRFAQQVGKLDEYERDSEWLGKEHENRE